MPLFQVTVPFQDGYDYGVGADLSSGSPMGKVVDGVADGVVDAEGAVTGFHVSRVHSTRDLESKLGIDVDANYGCSTFGAGVEARFNFAKEAKVHTDSLFMSITATVKLAFHSIDAPVLSERAQKLVGRPAVLADRYGNMFVRGIGRGGLFVAMMRIDTSSAEESQRIAGELGGSYGFFSLEAKAKFEELERNSRCEIEIQVYREGGPVELKADDVPGPTQLYQMLQAWLQSFKDNPAGNARPYYATLAPITIADGPEPPNLAQIQQAQDVLMHCARRRSELLDNINLMDYIAQHPERYELVEPVGVPEMVAASSDFQCDLQFVSRAASRAMNDPAQATMPAALAEIERCTYPRGRRPAPMPARKPGAEAPANDDIVVPDLSMVNEEKLKDEIGPKLLYSVSRVVSTAEGVGKVVGQDPGPGTMVRAGTIVNVSIGTLRAHAGGGLRIFR